MLGSVREVLGSGSFLGVSLFGPSYEPWIVMILPPGGFLTLGSLLLGLAWWQERHPEHSEAAHADPTAEAAAAVSIALSGPSSPGGEIR
jgi:electron transport complex protein RnfE